MKNKLIVNRNKIKIQIIKEKILVMKTSCRNIRYSFVEVG